MRIKSKDITPKRVASAILRRIRHSRHTISWNASKLSRQNKENITRYHNIHHGQKCFILGNGPSLAKTPFEQIGSKFTIGLNRVYLLEPTTGFVPSYYACINDLVLEQFSGEIAQLEMPKFVHWTSRDKFGCSKTKNLNYLHTKLSIKDNFEEDLTKPISSGGTVTFVALQLAYYLGFHDIVLLGVDHSFVEKGTPNKTETRNQEVDQSHFHPEYFPKGSKWQLPDLYRSELAYSIARNAFEANGRRIVDATIGGKLNVFQKVDLAEELNA